QKGNSQGDKKGQSSSSSDQKSDGNQKGQRDQEKQKKDKDKAGQGSDSDDQESSTKPPPSFHTSIASGLATALKWIVFAILALVVGLYLFRNGLKYLANFTQWARRLLAALDAFWQRLFGWWQRGVEASEGVEGPVSIPTPLTPFASFANPFRNGT